jgi:hypothetical protein
VKNKDEVDRIERQQLVKLVKNMLLDSDIFEARRHLKKLKTYEWENDTIKIIILFLFAYVPGCHKLLAMLR